MSTQSNEITRCVPRFAHKRTEAFDHLQGQIMGLLRKEGATRFTVTGTRSLCSAELHKLVPTAASEHFWHLRIGLTFPAFDSAAPLTLDQALDYFDFP